MKRYREAALHMPQAGTRHTQEHKRKYLKAQTPTDPSHPHRHAPRRPVGTPRDPCTTQKGTHPWHPRPRTATWVPHHTTPPHTPPRQLDRGTHGHPKEPSPPTATKQHPHGVPSTRPPAPSPAGAFISDTRSCSNATAATPPTCKPQTQPKAQPTYPRMRPRRCQFTRPRGTRRLKP